MSTSMNWSRAAAGGKGSVPHEGSALREEVTVDKQPPPYFLAHSVDAQLQLTVSLPLFLGRWLCGPAVKAESFVRGSSRCCVVPEFKITAVGVSNLEQTLQVQASGAAGTHQWHRADLPKIRCSLQCAELCVLLEGVSKPNGFRAAPQNWCVSVGLHLSPSELGDHLGVFLNSTGSRCLGSMGSLSDGSEAGTLLLTSWCLGTAELKWAAAAVGLRQL